MSTYSPDLRIELITTGDQAGTWGATTNTNLAYVIEQAIAGYVSVSVIASSQALTYINGGSSTAADNQSVHAALALTTTTGANFAVYAPPASKLYTIYNASSYVATIYNSTVIGNTTAAGTGVAIPAGKTMTVWSDGTNFAVQNSHIIGTVVGNVTGNLTGNVTGNVTGNLTGNVSGQLDGSITSATTAVTQSPGTSNTTVATTAFANAAFQGAYPVGSIYMNASVATNPATLFGFGTWVAFGAGRVLVGFDAGNALFDTAEETGGSADAIVVSHTHTDSGHYHSTDGTDGSNIHVVRLGIDGPIDATSRYASPDDAGYPNNTRTGTSTANISTTGSSGTNANYQPYITVYMWKRTA
jgi:hypothetical protein